MSLFRNLHALPPYTAEDHPTIITEKIRAMFAAPVHADRGGAIAVASVPVEELRQPEVTQESSVTSAYLDQYVTIPVLHGDQSMSGNFQTEPFQVHPDSGQSLGQALNSLPWGSNG